MKKESLYRIRKGIIETISKMDSLPQEDRVEGMINGNLFFHENDYEENVKVLRLHKENKKGR